MLDKKSKNEIVESLCEKIQSFYCPMCHQQKFTLVDGYISNVVQPDLSGIRTEGSLLPVASIVCGNCGFVSQHALGILGLLDKIKEDED